MKLLRKLTEFLIDTANIRNRNIKNILKISLISLWVFAILFITGCSGEIEDGLIATEEVSEKTIVNEYEEAIPQGLKPKPIPEYFECMGEKLPIEDADVVNLDEFNTSGIIEYHNFGYVVYPGDNAPTKVFVGDEILGAKVTGARAVFLYYYPTDYSSDCMLDGTEIFLEGQINFTGTIGYAKEGEPLTIPGAMGFSVYESSGGAVPRAYKGIYESFSFEPDLPLLGVVLVHFDPRAVPGLSEMYEGDHIAHIYNPEEFPGLFDESDKVSATITLSQLRLLYTNRSSGAYAAGTLLDLKW